VPQTLGKRKRRGGDSSVVLLSAPQIAGRKCRCGRSASATVPQVRRDAKPAAPEIRPGREGRACGSKEGADAPNFIADYRTIGLKLEGRGEILRFSLRACA
jgi:hypothetical protein